MKKIGFIVLGVIAVTMLTGCAVTGATVETTPTIEVAGAPLAIPNDGGIKIISAHEVPAVDGFTEASLHVYIEIEGYPLHIGGIDTALNRTALLDELYFQYDDLLAQAIQKYNTVEVPQDRWDLIDVEGLPHSQHIGKLVGIDPSRAKPATITRKLHGISFNINCLVSQSVVNMWLAGDLDIGDYVLVSFIDEHPDAEEVNLAIIVDKVYKSW